MGRFSDMVREEKDAAARKAEAADEARAAAIKVAADKKAVDDEIMATTIRPILEEARDDLIAGGIKSAIVTHGPHAPSQTVDLVIGDDGTGGYGKGNRPSRVTTAVRDRVVMIGVTGGRPALPEATRKSVPDNANTQLTEAVQAAVRRYLGTEAR